MSTTNPPPGGPRPGGSGPAGPQPGAGREWPNDATDLSRGDDSGGGGGVDPAALRAGHEPDVFAVPPIFAIPAAVVVTFLIAFGTAVLGFWFLTSQDPNDPGADPEAVVRGDIPLDDRLSRIDRAGMRDNPLREVDQPRLEPLKRLELNGKTTTRLELPTGNSPQIHPEEIAPDRYPGLQQSGWVEKGKVARLPIAEGLRLAAGNAGLNAKLFPVRKDVSRPLASADVPTGQNAGRGAVPPAPKAAQPPEAKKPEPAPAPKEQPKTEPPKAPEKK